MMLDGAFTHIKAIFTLLKDLKNCRIPTARCLHGQCVESSGI